MSSFSLLQVIPKLIWLTQVNGSTIVDKAKPEGSVPLGPGYIGCWRSHADTWRRMIKENILTALILEDDADWDVEVHDIFEELSRQMRKGELRSQPSTNHERYVAPYGTFWPSYLCVDTLLHC